jgi:hypothetical protein
MSGSADEKCRIVDGHNNETKVTQSGQRNIACSTICDKKSSALELLKSILSGYVRFIQSPWRQDSILKTVQYSLWLLSKFYRNSKTKHRLPHRVAQDLLKLQGEISWARYLLRFFGFPSAINDLDVKSSWATGNTSHRLGRVMSWTMVAYYPLENLAYLLWKAPGIRWLPILSPTPLQNPNSTGSCPNPQTSRHVGANRYSPEQLASKASAWSCRFWLAWIVLDIARCSLALREIQQTAPSERDGLSQTDDADETAKKDGDTKTITVRTEHLRLLRNALYVLPAISWSLPKWDTEPWLSGDFVNGLCWLESVVGLYQGVRDFQKIESAKP